MGTKRAPLGHCSWKWNQPSTQEALGPRAARQSSAAATPSRGKPGPGAAAVHSAGLALQPGIRRSHRASTSSSGNLLRGQQELRASPALTRQLPPQQHPGKSSISSSRIPAGGPAGPTAASSNSRTPTRCRLLRTPPSARWDAGGDARVGGGHTHTRTQKAPGYRRQRVTLSRAAAAVERHVLSEAREGAAGPGMSPSPAPQPPLLLQHELQQPTGGRARSISPTRLRRGTRFPARSGAKSAAGTRGELCAHSHRRHPRPALPRARAQARAHVPRQAATAQPGLHARPHAGCTTHEHRR